MIVRNEQLGFALERLRAGCRRNRASRAGRSSVRAAAATGRRSWSTSASARGSASIRRTCRSSVAGSCSAPRRRDGDQLLVRNAAPEEERQPRRQLEVADAERRAGRDAAGSRSKRNRNCGSTSTRATRPLDARLERAVLPGLRDRTQQRRPSRDRWRRPAADRRATPAVRIVRRIRSLRRRATVVAVPRSGRFGPGGGRRADEQAPPARRVTGPVGIERTGDRHLRDAGRARLDVIDAVGAGDARTHRPIAAAIVCGPAGNVQARRTAPCSVTRAPSSVDITDRRAADRRRAARAAQSARRRAWPDLQVVLGVEREGVPDDEAAARAERQAVDVRVLPRSAGHAIDDPIEPDGGIADRQRG